MERSSTIAGISAMARREPDRIRSTPTPWWAAIPWSFASPTTPRQRDAARLRAQNTPWRSTAHPGHRSGPGRARFRALHARWSEHRPHDRGVQRGLRSAIDPAHDERRGDRSRIHASSPARACRSTSPATARASPSRSASLPPTPSTKPELSPSPRLAPPTRREWCRLKAGATARRIATPMGRTAASWEIPSSSMDRAPRIRVESACLSGGTSVTDSPAPG